MNEPLWIEKTSVAVAPTIMCKIVTWARENQHGPESKSGECIWICRGYMGFGTKHFGILFGKVSVLNGELVECYMRHLYVSATRGTGYGFARVQGLHRVLFANGSL